MADQTDLLLVEQLRAGNELAFEQLVDRYQGRLLAFARRKLHNANAADDVVQNTFVGFLVSLPNYDETRTALESYIFSIAAHKIQDYIRAEGRRPVKQFGSTDDGRPIDEVPGDFRPASSVMRSDERRDREERFLAETLGKLIRDWVAKREFTRLKCVELMLVNGRPNKEVAALLGLTEQAVASFKHQVKTKLTEEARKAGVAADHLLGETEPT